ncbi:MAG: N-acetylglucosamine-6-phosphate deacetylase [Pirellulaceae bacterium]|nr:MAG: N-acetylglucosamine-6-phosphate deacetylase [Pirellulaceae bacterium]
MRATGSRTNYRRVVGSPEVVLSAGNMNSIATVMADLIANYVDLQVNGYVGVDFNDPHTPLHRIHEAAEAMRKDGVVAALPTIITGAADVMIGCMSKLVQAIEEQEETRALFRGIHMEGPFLSPVPGYIGAHPVEHARPQDLDLLGRLCDAAGDHLRLVTLAPEVDRGGRMTRFLTQRGIVVAAGHTDASLDQLRCALDEGLQLFTHLGNGCPRKMDRHDNILWRAMRLRDRLKITLIADGFHVPAVVFPTLLEWFGGDRVAVVSDAISAAGLGPGTYQLGSRSVVIGPDRACRDASGEHFVGSASRMQDAERWLADTLQLELATRRQLLFDNPRSWLGL